MGARRSAVTAFCLMLTLSIPITALVTGDVSISNPVETVLVSVSIGFGGFVLLGLAIRLFAAKFLTTQALAILMKTVSVCILLQAILLTLAIVLGKSLNTQTGPFNTNDVLLIIAASLQYLAFLFTTYDAFQFADGRKNGPVSAEQLKFLLVFYGLALYLIAGGIMFSALEGWPYRRGAFFCIVTLTTVGYGTTVPTTDAGKIALLFYALVGLGLMATLLAYFSHSYTTVFEKNVRQSVSLLTLFAITMAFWLLGALVFSITEGWSYLDATYFSLVTLATIGYGDFVTTTATGTAFAFFFTFAGVALFSAFIGTIWGKISDETSPDH